MTTWDVKVSEVIRIQPEGKQKLSKIHGKSESGWRQHLKVHDVMSELETLETKLCMCWREYNASLMGAEKQEI